MMHKKVDFSLHVKEVLNRNNIQIRSLALVDEELKSHFFNDRKKAILLIRNKVYEREIDSVDDNNIDIYDTVLIPYIKKGHLVLLVLPSDKKKRYVLQTMVSSVYVDRFRLTALDPRKNRRFSSPQGMLVTIRTIPDALALRIQTGELRSVRQGEGIMLDELPDDADTMGDKAHAGEDFTDKDFQDNSEENSPDGGEQDMTPEASSTTATPQPTQSSSQISIIDIIYQAEKKEQAQDYITLKEQSSVSGMIVDVSLGGMCLTFEGKKDLFFADQLVVLESDLTQEPVEGSNPVDLRLFVFAVVRNLGEKNGLCSMNLEFLSRLPRAAEVFFPKKEE